MKGDRFEQTVEKRFTKLAGGRCACDDSYKYAAIELLRAEHRRTVRTVKAAIDEHKQRATDEASTGGEPFEWDMKAEALSDLLAQLTKGKRP